MKSRVGSVLRFALLLASGTALLAGEPAANTLTDLEKAINNELAQRPAQSAVNPRPERDAMLLYGLRTAFEHPESRPIDDLLTQVLVSFHSEPVRSAVEKLRVAARAEREAKDNALAAKCERTVRAACKATHDAKTPSELDATIRDLSAAETGADGSSEATRACAARIRTARQFVVYWQDYLAQVGGGRWNLAEQSLQSASNLTSADLIPRSEILARIDTVKEQTREKQELSVFSQLRQIMAKAKTLDDLPAAIDAARDLRGRAKAEDKWADPAVQLHDELAAIQQSYDDYRAGLPTIVQVRSDHRGDAAEAGDLALPLRVQLLRIVLPRYLQVEEKPQPDEPIDHYIERMMRAASDRCDARLIARVYHARNAMNGIANPIDLAPGLDALVAARNQEDAGQFAPAVISYNRALRLGGEAVPVQVVGTRLAAIKADHPAEYEAGMKRYLQLADPGPSHVAGSVGAFSLRVPAGEPSPH